MKFIHSADIHLGRQFSGLCRSSPSLGKLFLEAGYLAWKRIIDHALAEQVDFVALGGDIFDASNPSLRPRVTFRDGILRLKEAGIPVYAVLGNHDSLKTFPDSLRSLPGFFLFGPEADAQEILQGAVIQGVSFESPAVTANLARTITRVSGAELAIGLLHTNVSGNKDHGNYAPCTLDDLRASGMDIWCLGHVHSPSVLLDDPLIVYSGAAQGARPNETGPLGCYLVSIENDKNVGWEFVPVAPVIWEDIILDVADAKCPEDVLDAAEVRFSESTHQPPGTNAVVARIHLCGESPSSAMSGIANDDEFRNLLSERLANRELPVFVADLVDDTSAQNRSMSRVDEEGFLADFFRLADKSVMDPILRGAMADRIQEELTKLGRKHYEGVFDISTWRQEQRPVMEHVNGATEMVLHLLRESQ